MTGLDNLLEKIKMQSLEEERKIMHQAENQAKEILDNSKSVVEKEASKLEIKLEQERISFIDRLKSNAEIKARNSKLESKQKVIKRAFDEVLEELKSMGNDEYIKYIKAHNISDNSTLVVTEDKYELVKNQFPNIKVSDNRYASSGFIEVRDDSEQNYTFESRLKLIKEEIEGKLANILFADR